MYVLFILFNLFLFFFIMVDGSKDLRGVSERLFKKVERDKYVYVYLFINDFKILKIWYRFYVWVINLFEMLLFFEIVWY